jgi:hypothetical protein
MEKPIQLRSGALALGALLLAMAMAGRLNQNVFEEGAWLGYLGSGDQIFLLK